MTDKKNEDYVVRMPEGSNVFGNEKDAFLGRSPRGGNHHNNGLASLSKLDNSPGISILSYCLASISMTVVNKYVVSGSDWNLNFFYLAVQVCSGEQRLREKGLVLVLTDLPSLPSA